MRPPLLRAIFFGLTLQALMASTAHAHQQLLSASPADGDSLTAAPEEIRLTFNQSIEPSLARLTLTGPRGDIALGPLTVPDDNPTVMFAAVTGPLVAGEYTVHWLVTGDDGHPVRGEIRFVIGEGAVGTTADSTSVAAEVVAGTRSRESPPAAEMESRLPVTAEPLSPGAPLYVAVRWLNFAGIVVVIGAVCFWGLLLGRLRRRGPIIAEPMLERMRGRAAVVGLAGGLWLLNAHPLRLLAQTAALHGAGGASGPELIPIILTRSSWGRAWLLEATAVVLTIVGFALARRGRRIGWWTAAVAALLLAITPALSGHAIATSAAAVVSDAVHVFAAGGWLGTLLVMMVAGLPPLVEAGSARKEAVGALLASFSPVALAFAAALALTGVYAAWLHLTGIATLWSSAYGRTLLLKLGALVLLFGTGAYNWRRARPALALSGDPRPLRRSATVELTLGTLVLAITAALVATPPPTHAAPVAGIAPAEAPTAASGAP